MARSPHLANNQLVPSQTNAHITLNNTVSKIERAANRAITYTVGSSAPISVTELESTSNHLFIFKDADNDFSVIFPSEVNTDLSATPNERVYHIVNADTSYDMTVDTSGGMSTPLDIGPGEGALVHQFEDEITVLITGPYYGGLELTRRVDFSVFFPGEPEASETLLFYVFSKSALLPEDFDGSVGGVGTNPTASYTIDVSKNGTSIGSITIGTGGAFTFDTTGGDVFFAPGDKLKLTGQSTADSTLKDISITLVGFK